MLCIALRQFITIKQKILRISKNTGTNYISSYILWITWFWCWLTQRITRHSQGSIPQRLLLICILDTALIQVTGEFSSIHMDFSYLFELSDKEWSFCVGCICCYNIASCYGYFPHLFYIYIPNCFQLFCFFGCCYDNTFFSLFCKETLKIHIKYFNTLQIFETLCDLTKYHTQTLAHKPMAGNVLHWALQPKASHSVSKAMRWISYYIDENQNKLCCL